MVTMALAVVSGLAYRDIGTRQTQQQMNGILGNKRRTRTRRRTKEEEEEGAGYCEKRGVLVKVVFAPVEQ